MRLCQWRSTPNRSAANSCTARLASLSSTPGRKISVSAIASKSSAAAPCASRRCAARACSFTCCGRSSPSGTRRRDRRGRTPLSPPGTSQLESGSLARKLAGRRRLRTERLSTVRRMAEQVSVSREIAAPAEQLWAMVSDVTRMGEWSPENEAGEWLRGATGPKPGASFRGTNRNGKKTWKTVATVVDAEARPPVLVPCEGVGPQGRGVAVRIRAERNGMSGHRDLGRPTRFHRQDHGQAGERCRRSGRGTIGRGWSRRSHASR